MHVRRPLLAVTGLALTALLAGCAGDDLAAEDEPTSGSGGGEGTSVVIGSQSFDEAALVTAMYQQLLEGEGYEVVRDESGDWEVRGREAIRAVRLSDLTNPEALDEAHRRLKSLGIDRALERAGAKPGDTVHIGTLSFDYEAD